MKFKFPTFRTGKWHVAKYKVGEVEYFFIKEEHLLFGFIPSWIDLGILCFSHKEAISVYLDHILKKYQISS